LVVLWRTEEAAAVALAGMAEKRKLPHTPEIDDLEPSVLAVLLGRERHGHGDDNTRDER
jgi:hypothetical protein